MRKRTIRIIQWLLLAAFIASFAGCAMFGETMTMRVESFIDDINAANWSGVVSNNLDPNAGQYDNANTSSFWSSYFGNPGAYGVSSVTEYSSYAEATITGGVFGSNGATVRFYFTEEPGLLGSTYKISKITYGGTTVFQ